MRPSQSNRHGRVGALCVLAITGFARWASAQTDASGAAGDAAEAKSQRLELMKDAARRYEIVSDDGTEYPLREEPILRWSNPIRKTPDGAVFLWTDDGRPRAACCVFPSGEATFDHEFVSLADGPFTASDEGEPVWTPPGAGVEWNPVPGAPQPARSAPLRLTQMRELSRRFTATVGRQNPQDVRLLPQPVHRYSSESAGVADGATFAFVQGTDPEILLLLEAAGDGDQSEWRYAAARMSSMAMVLKHQEVEVWSVPYWPRDEKPDQPYVNLARHYEALP